MKCAYVPYQSKWCEKGTVGVLIIPISYYDVIYHTIWYGMYTSFYVIIYLIYILIDQDAGRQSDKYELYYTNHTIRISQCLTKERCYHSVTNVFQ